MNSTVTDSIKERPILMNGPNVNAILEDIKTQTRRVIKKQPIDSDQEIKFENGWLMYRRAGIGWSNDQLCPYGKPGDRLWVRESYIHCYRGENPGACKYLADAGTMRWLQADSVEQAKSHWGPFKRSIHMFRWASRILLEITDIRVERLNDISEQDAIAEGIESIYQKERFGGGGWYRPDRALGQTASSCFQHLWESINGKGSWDKNDWVWIIEFRRCENDRS